MFDRNEYEIFETIRQNGSSKISRALHLPTNTKVILKELNNLSANTDSVSRFTNEKNILQNLDNPHVQKICESISNKSSMLHVYKNIEGYEIYDLIQEKKLSFVEILDIALQIAQGLQYLHDNSIIHANINPHNILYSQKTKQVTIVDFENAIAHKDSSYKIDTEYLSLDSLLYIAPEQLKIIDSSFNMLCDYYSFGMTLYYMLGDKPAYEFADKFELIHKQIAQNPISLHKINKKIPLFLSNIVDKLISKNPQQRYLSDEAIIHDLEHCLDDFKNFGRINTIELAQRDKPALNIGEHLFAREKEITLLRHAANEINSGIQTNIIVHGESGIGKTALIKEFLKNFNDTDIRIVQSKFDFSLQDVPYFTIKQLFTNIYTLLMSQKRLTNLRLEETSVLILTKLFPVLTDLLPSVAHPMDIAITKAKLHFAITDFFNAIANKQNPLLIFIDDLQWGDTNSFEIILQSIVENKNPYLHFIGSYRDNEENSSLTYIQEHFQSQKFKTYNIDLKAFSYGNLENMLYGLFNFSSSDIRDLTETIYLKSDGNPFYIKSILNHFIDTNILTYSNKLWSYDTQKLLPLNQTLDITTIIQTHLSKLNKDEKKAIEHFALLGYTFATKTALNLLKSFKMESSILDSLIEKQLLEPYSHQYKFIHDKIQKFIYDNISVKNKHKYHLTIAKVLEKSYKEKKFDDISLLVEHYNLAYPEGKHPKKLYKLNLLSLEYMLLNNLHILALKRSVWIEDNFSHLLSWKENKKDTYQFTFLKTKALYLSAKHKDAYKNIQTLIAYTNTIEQNIECFSLFKDLCVTMGSNFNELLNYGRKAVRLLGLTIPNTLDLPQSNIDLLQKIQQNKALRDIEKIVNMKALKNKEIRKINYLLVEFWEASYYTADIDLMKFAYLTIVHNSLTYGNESESSFGYVLYGGYLISQKEYQQAYRVGQIALKLNQKYTDTIMLPKINNFVANFISPFSKKYTNNIPLYKKSLQQSKINGEIIFGTWANFLMHFSDYLAGTSLDSLQENLRTNSDFLLASGDQKMINIFRVLEYSVEKLIDHKADISDQENEYLSLWESENFYPGLAWYAILKAQDMFLHNKIDEGLHYLNRYVHNEDSEVIMFPKVRLHFLRALLLYAKKGELTPTEQTTLQKDVDFYTGLYAQSQNSFKCQGLLLKAESMKKTQDKWSVAKAYEKAIAEALKESNYFFIALTNLCANRFWLEQKFIEQSKTHLHEAITAFNQWGAKKLSTTLQEEAVLDTQLNSFSNMSNFKNIVQSFQTISKSLNIRDTLKALLEFILQNATASKAILIFKTENKYLTRAISDFQENETSFYNTEIDNDENIPHSIVRYSINTQKSLQLIDPAEDETFQLDRYIKSNKPNSCISIPCIIDGDVQAVLYIENKDIATYLSADTIATLEMVLTQTSIIYQNSILFENLKKSQQDFKNAQKISKVGNWHFNSNNETIEWSEEVYRIYEMEPFCRDIDYEWFARHLHPDDVEMINKAVELAMKGERYYDVSHRIITAKGNIKYVHQLAEAYEEDGIQRMSGIIQDVTQAKEKDDDILRLSEVFKQSPFSVIITDPQGLIKHTNPECEKLTGYIQQELLDRNMNIFKSGQQSYEFYTDLWNTISKEKTVWKGTMVNTMKDKSLVDCQSTIFPILDANNEIINYVTIQEDVTEQNAKEKIFLMQTRQAQMGEMLSMIAHQWRQPLATINAIAIKQRLQISLEKATFEDLSKGYDNIETQVKHLSETIDDFRNFFKPDKEKSKTKISTILTKSLTILGHSFENENIRVTKNYQDDPLLLTYENELEQAFISILRNMQDIFIERHIKNPTIDITSIVDNESCIITIQDNGLGIEANVLDTLFLPYVSTKSEKQGTGLGLYMSKTIIEEHCQGKVQAGNAKDGAIFTITLPLNCIS